MSRLVFLAFNALLVSISLTLIGCPYARECSDDNPCPASLACVAGADGSRACAVPSGEEGEGEGEEGEGEGEEGEGEGETPDVERVDHVIFLVDGEPVAESLVFTAATIVTVQAHDQNDDQVAGAVCNPSRIEVPEPAPDTEDQVLFARCTTKDGIPEEVGVPGDLGLLPLAAAPRPDVKLDPTIEFDANALVIVNEGAECSFTPTDPSPREQLAQITCARGEESVTVDVQLDFNVSATLSGLALDAAGDIVQRVSAFAVARCAVDCGETPVLTSIFENGEAELVVPSAVGPVVTSCEVTCENDGDQETIGAFNVVERDVFNADDLAALVVDEVNALRGVIIVSAPFATAPSVTGAEALQVVTGAFSLRDSAPGEVFYAFPALTHIGGTFELPNNTGLVKTDRDDNLQRPAAFPVLARVGGNFTVQSNASLEILSLPRLEAVGGAFRIESNAQLRTIELPSLISVGSDPSLSDFVISRNNVEFGCDDVETLADQLFTACVPSTEFIAQDDQGDNCALTCT